MIQKIINWVSPKKTTQPVEDEVTTEIITTPNSGTLVAKKRSDMSSYRVNDGWGWGGDLTCAYIHPMDDGCYRLERYDTKVNRNIKCFSVEQALEYLQSERERLIKKENKINIDLTNTIK